MSRPHSISFKGEQTLTKQAFKDACDINQIMLRYQKTGIVDHVAKHGGNYADLDGSTFLEHMQIVANAKTMFEELPSKARKAFDQDPAKFLDYVQDLTPEKEQRLIDLGLANQRVPLQPESTPTPPPENQDVDEA